MPACVMAAARINRPTIIVYGGTIQPGVREVDCPAFDAKKGDHMTAVDAFESFGTAHFHNLNLLSLTMASAGAFTVGKISEEERFDVVRHSCPGAGACGGMFTYVRSMFQIQNVA